jgi:hypothetical protein
MSNPGPDKESGLMSTRDPSDPQGYTDEELIRMYDPFAFEHNLEQESVFPEDETRFVHNEGGTVNPLTAIPSSSTGSPMPVPSAFSDEVPSGSQGRWKLIGGLSIAVAIISILVLVLIASLPTHHAANQVVIQHTETPTATVLPTLTPVPVTATLTPSPKLTPSPPPITFTRHVTVQASNINGTSLSVPYMGTYQFTITGGSYSDGPVPNYPWTSAVYVYIDEPIQWGSHYFSPPFNETVTGPINPSFYLGYEDFQSTTAAAANEAVGFTRTITLHKNDVLLFITLDDQRTYFDDPGQMDIVVSYM